MSSMIIDTTDKDTIRLDDEITKKERKNKSKTGNGSITSYPHGLLSELHLVCLSSERVMGFRRSGKYVRRRV